MPPGLVKDVSVHYDHSGLQEYLPTQAHLGLFDTLITACSHKGAKFTLHAPFYSFGLSIIQGRLIQSSFRFTVLFRKKRREK